MLLCPNNFLTPFSVLPCFCPNNCLTSFSMLPWHLQGLYECRSWTIKVIFFLNFTIRLTLYWAWLNFTKDITCSHNQQLRKEGIENWNNRHKRNTPQWWSQHLVWKCELLSSSRNLTMLKIAPSCCILGSYTNC